MVLHVHITAFGPYGGVLVNPTSVLVGALPYHIKQHPLPSNISIDSLTQIETSAAAVERALTQLHAQVSDAPASISTPASTDSASPTPSSSLSHTAVTSSACLPPSVTTAHSHLWIHLGVHPRSPCVCLEHRGVNEADFRIPDQQGWQPHGGAILADQPLFRETRVDLARVKARLDDEAERRDCGWTVVESWDAGRYICNLAYFASLCRSHQRTEAAATAVAAAAASGVRHDSLFVHCPPFEAIGEARQLDFLHTLLRVLSEMEAEGEGSWRLKEGSGVPLALGGPGNSAVDLLGRGMMSDQLAAVGQPALNGHATGLS